MIQARENTAAVPTGIGEKAIFRKKSADRNCYAVKWQSTGGILGIRTTKHRRQPEGNNRQFQGDHYD